MDLVKLVEPSLDALTANYESNKLLLIHPSSRYRTLLIAALIDSAPTSVFYFGLSVNDTNLEQFLTSLIRDLAEQVPTFGRHLNDARNDDPEDLEGMAMALGRDLDELDEDHYLFVIDEYDRADQVPEIQTFLEYLLNYLPPQTHLLINSRSLPRLPWVALVARHEAVVLKDSRLLTSGFYSEQLSENPNVEVFALGPGYVMLNGQIVDTWEGHLPRLLFFFALDRPMVTRADICQAFWPELPIDQAVNVFHVTKRRLHKALGFDALIHESGHYRINQTLNMNYDVVEFVGHLVEARTAETTEEAAEHWKATIDLYRGDYLQGHDDAWITLRRGDFREGYLEALAALGRIREEQGQQEQALGLYLRAVGEAGNREDIHLEIMRLYSEMGRRGEAVEHYERLVDDLDRRYGLEPSAEIQTIYKEIVGG